VSCLSSTLFGGSSQLADARNSALIKPAIIRHYPKYQLFTWLSCFASYLTITMVGTIYSSARGGCRFNFVV
jgi:hypothetical protein